MSVFVRDATPDDAQAMVAILNPIIAEGSTTAHRRPFDRDRMIGHYIAPPRLISCKLAVLDGEIVGFQSTTWADPEYDGPDPLPADWATLGTFVRQGLQARGVGAALFAATREAAQAAGAVAIDATIRADNVPGLAYYTRMGFVDYAVLKDIPLSDGKRVDRIRKGYDLS